MSGASSREKGEDKVVRVNREWGGGGVCVFVYLCECECECVSVDAIVYPLGQDLPQISFVALGDRQGEMKSK